MTFEEIRSGMVRGPERIVTMLPGAYGWPGESSLHVVHRYDARGGQAAYGVMTTVDKDGVRSELKLKKHESAVIEKLPLSLKTDAPVNLIVHQYDAKAIKLVLNGKAKGALQISSGTFDIKPGAAYRVKGAAKDRVKAGARGQLSVPLRLDGRTEVEIRKAR